MHARLPTVIRWDSFPLDIRDPFERFRLSRFNYLLKDREAQVIFGFWEAADGQEVIGEKVGGGVADEILVVLEGQLHVSSPGEPEQIAGPGDVVAALHDRQTRIVVKGRARAFFLTYGLDPAEAEQVMTGNQP